MLLRLDVGQHVSFGHTATVPTTRNLTDIQAILGGQATHRRAQTFQICFRRGRERRGGGGSTRRRRGGGGFGRGLDSPFLQRGDHVAGGHDVTFLPQNLPEHTVRRGGNVQHDLIGLQIHEVFASLHRLTWLFLPVDQSAVGDGFRKSGDFHFYGHCICFP